MRLLPVIVTACLATSLPAFAEVPAPQKMKCPVGGEEFTYSGYAAYSTYGQRFDGKPYGSTFFPLRLPVCPRNGFIILREVADYTPAEVAKYADIIARPAFKKLTAEETTYYRASYLEREGGGTSGASAWLLLQATWEADRDPALHKRYQEEFIDYVDSIATNMPRTGLDWWIFQYYAANAERQIGRFDAALSRIAAVRSADPPRTVTGDPDWSRDGFLEMVSTIETLAKANDARLDKEDRR